MNWMIDGVYGDLYRTAMQYPAQRAAHEPDPETPVRRRSTLRRVAASFTAWLAASAAKGHKLEANAATKLHLIQRSQS